jgi:predicted double-glycine peptidase
MRRPVLPILVGSVLAALPALSGPVRAGEIRITSDQSGVSAAVAVRSWRDIPFRSVVRQQFDFSCGSAALATLLRFHYGQAVDEAVLFKAMWDVGDQAKIRKVGFSLLDMKRALAARGLKADGYRLTLDQLARAGVPAVALVTVGRYRHFVVIKGVQGGRVLVGDPALGLEIYPRGDFEKTWNGVVFLIHDGASGTPAFNRPSEWRPWAMAPLEDGLDHSSLAAFTQALPPIYQISPVLNLPAY